MSLTLILALVAVFVSVAIAAGAAASLALLPMNAERRRLRTLTAEGASGSVSVVATPKLTDSLSPLAQRVSNLVPKSPQSLSLLRRRLTTAGYRELSHAMWFSAAKIALMVVFALGTALVVGFSGGTWGWARIGMAALS
ncbi:MAG: hypothetical protein AB7P22_11470, partial [Vicinamibacterales bacterium]